MEDELIQDAEDHTPTILKQSCYYDNNEFIELLQLKKNVVKLISLNCQSLNAKIDDIRIFIEMLKSHSCNLDILCLQETWLSASSDVSHLQIEGYTLITRGKSCSAHGGVAIYISDMFDFDVLPIESLSNSWDGLFIEARIKNYANNSKKIVFGNIYRPPRNRIENYRAFNEEINEITSNLQRSRQEVILTGDFNLDLLKINEKVHIHENFETL